MDTNILQEFIELAKRLNFTETARVLNMSQPTLSKHISSLEKELRVPLFDRTGAALRLTGAGAELLPYAYKVMAAQSELYAKVKTLKATPPPRLTVGGFVNEEIVTEMLGRIISSLGERYGTNFIEVKQLHHKLPKELLEKGDINLVFDYAAAYELDEHDGIESVMLGRLPWIALMSKNHPLAQRNALSIDDLKGETLIKIEGTHVSEAWRYIEAACRRHGFEPLYRRHYGMRLTDLVTASANLENDILILGVNFVNRIGVGITPFCTRVPFADDDAAFPLSALFRADDDNPILAEAIETMIGQRESGLDELFGGGD